MKRDQIRRIVQDCISNTHNCQYEARDIKDDHRLKDDLGLDSLDYIEMICFIEKELKISISDEEIEGSENISIGEIIELVKSKTS